MIFSKLKSASNWLTDFRTPRVGFEPTTLRLTAECSTAELSRTTFIIINTLHAFCKCFFHFLCTLKTTYKFKSLLHPFFLTLSYLLGYALDRLVTVSSMHPGAEVGPKGWAVRPLKRYASWVQNVVRQFGPYPAWA